jgi:3-oxoacyl-[acyl-carrier protein] reductase
LSGSPAARSATHQWKEAAMTKLLSIPDLVGKAVLVTGASTGIGAALARAFAEQGASVGVHYNASAAAAETLCADIRAAGGKATAVHGDALKSADMVRVIEETAMTFGRLDGLVNNAGGMVARMPYGDFDEQVFEDIIGLNVRSVLVASHAALPFLKAQQGFIVNTTSIAARTGASLGAGPYGSAKAFIENATRGMAKEFAPFGVRVNAVAPGIVETPFHERYSDQAYLEAMRVTIPLQRLAKPEDMVGPYLFLASAVLSGYMTGQVLEVNGGQLMT